MTVEELRARAQAARERQAKEAAKKARADAKAKREKVKAFDELYRSSWIERVQYRIDEAADNGRFEVNVLLDTTGYKAGEIYRGTYEAVAAHFAEQGFDAKYRPENIMECHGDGCGPGDDEHRIVVSWRG
jgi:hypothetical protein